MLSHLYLFSDYMIEKNNILITGGSVRIGREISLAVASNLNNIIIHYNRSSSQASKLKHYIEKLGSKCAIIKCDLSKKRNIQNLIKKSGKFFGPINCLINNASVFENDNINNFTLKSWDKHMNVNLYSPIKLSSDLAKQLPAKSKGHIINILDQNILKPEISFLSYSLSKAALYSATKILAKSFAPNIRVNSIGPGPSLKNIHQSSKHFEKSVKKTLLKIGSPPEEIAKTVKFLLESKSITGQFIAVDGGEHLS